MTESDQIKALAELDGKSEMATKYFECSAYADAQLRNTGPGESPYSKEFEHTWDFLRSQVSYLTSYDAIIPVIQKQDDETKIKFMTKICMIYADVIGCDPDDVSSGWALTSLPVSDICEALLRATGKWKE